MVLFGSAPDPFQNFQALFIGVQDDIVATFCFSLTNATEIATRTATVGLWAKLGSCSQLMNRLDE